MVAKYIVFDNVMPIVFPDSLVHKEVANIFLTSKGMKPTSAGFCYIDETYCCYGESTSLNLKSNIDDSNLLDSILNSI